jgi:uncharacterized membrane protein
VSNILTVLSKNKGKTAVFVAAILGLLDSIYLTWIKLTNTTAACGGVGDCESVNNSSYSEIGGIPIALLGAGAYLLIILVLWFEERKPSFRDTADLILLGITLTGTLYSGYLTYIEVAVLKAICPYCVVSAVIIVALLISSIYRILNPREGD